MKSLKEFLKEKGMLEKFADNAIKQGKDAEYINRTDMENKITAAFRWGETKEGGDTWAKLHIEWVKTNNEQEKFINELM